MHLNDGINSYITMLSTSYQGHFRFLTDQIMPLLTWFSLPIAFNQYRFSNKASHWLAAQPPAIRAMSDNDHPTIAVSADKLVSRDNSFIPYCIDMLNNQTLCMLMTDRMVQLLFLGVTSMALNNSLHKFVIALQEWECWPGATVEVVILITQ